MKKTIAVIFALLSAAVFAGMNDLLITFSTPGVDKYADGKEVLEGERYALFFTDAEGKLGEEPVLVYRTKAAGRCTPVLFIIDEKVAEEKYKDGSWGVYLLDTRDFEKDATGNELADDPNPEAGEKLEYSVKAPATDAKTIVKKSMDSASATAAVSSDSFDIPKPTVTAIKVEGAYVYVTVKDIVPCLEYTLKSGSDAQNFAVPEGVEKDASSTVKEITLAVPKKEGAQFFKVTTK